MADSAFPPEIPSPCPVCGAKLIPEYALFCHTCGHDLRKMNKSRRDREPPVYDATQYKYHDKLVSDMTVVELQDAVVDWLVWSQPEGAQ